MTSCDLDKLEQLHTKLTVYDKNDEQFKSHWQPLIKATKITGREFTPYEKLFHIKDTESYYAKIIIPHYSAIAKHICENGIELPNTLLVHFPETESPAIDAREKIMHEMVTEHFWRWSWVAHPGDETRLITDDRKYHGIKFKFYKPIPADTEKNKIQQTLVQTAYNGARNGICTYNVTTSKEFYIHKMYEDASFQLKPGYYTDTGIHPASEKPSGMGPVYEHIYNHEFCWTRPRVRRIQR
jgi:hypothetical protein